MIILPLAALVLLTDTFHRRSGAPCRAFMQALLSCYAYGVIVAEITSLFTAYSIVPVSLFWAGALAGIFVYRKKHRGESLAVRLRRVKNPSFAEISLITVAILFAAAILAKAIAFPPNLPLDSVNYHLPRALMYYETESIHNFPTFYGHMLFFGQFNAVMISQTQILCFGSNALGNLVQFSGWLLGMAAVYELTAFMGLKRFYRVAAASFFCFLPMAAMQAATTQCDVLLAALAACAVYFMLAAVRELKESGSVHKETLIFSGLALGLTAMCKVSGGLVVLPFLLYFIISFIVRKKIRGIVILTAVLVIALCITGGYWLRNALLLEGDFTGLLYFSLNDGSAAGLTARGLIAVKNLVTTFSWLDAPLLKNIANGAVGAYCTASGLSVNTLGTNENNYDFNIMNMWYTPDTCPYPVQSLICMAALIAVFVWALLKKKKGTALYCAMVSVSLLLTAASFLWNTSAVRYIMAPITLAIPAAMIMFSWLEKSDGKTSSMFISFSAAIVCAVMALSFYTAAKSSFNEQVRNNWANLTYEQRAYISIGVADKTYLDNIEAYVREHDFDSVGIRFENLNGIYNWMYPFISDGLDVRFVFCRFMPSAEEERDYTPDCIIALIDADKATETMTYKGNVYLLISGPGTEFGGVECDTENDVYFYVKE